MRNSKPKIFKIRTSPSRRTKSGIFISDSKQTTFLIEMGKLSGQLSIRENKALGLPITYLEDGKIIREYSDGKKVEIGKLDNA